MSISRIEYKTHTLFMTQTDEKQTISFGAAHTYIAHIREYRSPHVL